MAIGTFANSAGQIVTIGVWFALTPFILDRLGPTRFGLWALVAAFIAYGRLLDFGLGLAVTKYVAEFRVRGEPEKASSLIATALRLYCLLGLVAVVLSIPLALVLPDLINVPASERSTLSWLLVLTGLAVAVELPATTAYAVLQGLNRFDISNLISSLAMLVLGAATLLVLLLGGGLLGMVAVIIPLTLVWQVPAVRSIRRVAPELEFGFGGARRDLFRTVAGFSTSLFVLHASSLVKRKTDELVIAAVLPVARVTPYAVARRLSDLPELATYQFAQVLMPIASGLDAKKDSARLRALTIASTRLALAMVLPLGAGLVVLAGPLLAAWVGPEYRSSADIVLILVAAGALEIGVWPTASILQGMARHRPLAVISAGSAALNLALSILLVHRLGITGVALGTLIAAAAEAIAVIPYVLSVSGVRPRVALKEILVPAMAPVAPMLAMLFALRELMNPSSLFAIGAVAVVGILVYAGGYLGFPSNRQERQAVLRMASATPARVRALVR